MRRDAARMSSLRFVANAALTAATGRFGPALTSSDGAHVAASKGGRSRAAIRKRILDVFGTLALLPLAVPLLALVALVLVLSGNRPVLFWQRRVGLAGRIFWFPKLTSMHHGSEGLHRELLPYNDHKDSVTFKMRRDPRVTRIGRIIRTLSLDELPQLWCVLRGDMSLVGPRPPLPSEVALYTPMQRRRLEVKPGLTCIWQVSGRSTVPFEQQVHLDIQYVEAQSMALDLKLLLRTVPAVLSCKGAY